MKSIKKNQSGFGAVEILLAIVIIAILGAVGWYVLKAKKNTTASYNNAASSSTVTKPIVKPKTTSQTKTSSTTKPTAADIKVAHVAMLAYCNKNKASKDTCSIDSTGDKTAPGFVEVGGGASYNGYASDVGVYIAKYVSGTWTVVWFGNGCTPKATVTQYSIPSAIVPDGGC